MRRPVTGRAVVRHCGWCLRLPAGCTADGTTDHIRFGTRVLSADWSSADAVWTVHLEQVATGEASVVECCFLYSCTGYYRYDRGYAPEFEGR